MSPEKKENLTKKTKKKIQFKFKFMEKQNQNCVEHYLSNRQNKQKCIKSSKRLAFMCSSYHGPQQRKRYSVFSIFISN